jgi:hypothetical protein
MPFIMRLQQHSSMSTSTPRESSCKKARFDDLRTVQAQQSEAATCKHARAIIALSRQHPYYSALLAAARNNAAHQ